jgi:putative ABC transport system permease protein
MIGIITYISVLERTKEIGILRAIGASKKDIGRVFNAETIFVGLVAGIIGIVCSLGLIVVINIILYHFTGIAHLKAVLEPLPAIILVAISMVLTLVAGLFPSKMASNKDPVIALRTE